MLTNEQKKLLHMAKAEAELDDADYRESLATIAGVSSSTDPELGNELLDVLLAYFEAICWRKKDAGQLQGTCKPRIFTVRGFWASRNRRENTSRDRYNHITIQIRIEELEQALATLGYGPEYCAAIREKVTRGSETAQALYHYSIALERTYTSKQRGNPARNKRKPVAPNVAQAPAPDAPEPSPVDVAAREPTAAATEPAPASVAGPAHRCAYVPLGRLTWPSVRVETTGGNDACNMPFQGLLGLGHSSGMLSVYESLAALREDFGDVPFFTVELPAEPLNLNRCKRAFQAAKDDAGKPHLVELPPETLSDPSAPF